MKRRHGFTLIELLVVVAIIAVLAAILFPVFAAARERSRTAMCASNLRQIGAGIELYASNFDDTYPPNWQYQTWEGGWWTVQQQMDRLIQGKFGMVWWCPSDPSLDRDLYALQSQFGSSYHLSFLFFDLPYGARCYSPKQEDRTPGSVKRASSTIMVYEWGPGGDGVPGGGLSGLASPKPDGWYVNRYLRDTHQGRANYLFADGHVRALTLRQTLTPEVLYDRRGDWCPNCPCADDWAWTDDTVKQSLAGLDAIHAP